MSIRVTVSKILANVFLSAKVQRCTNHKAKPGKFGIAGLGKDSGVYKGDSRENKSTPPKVISM